MVSENKNKQKYWWEGGKGVVWISFGNAWCCQNLSGCKSVGSCATEIAPGYSTRVNGWKRRRKIHTDEMYVWHLSYGRRRAVLWRGKNKNLEPLRRSAQRNRDGASGVAADSGAQHWRKYLCGSLSFKKCGTGENHRPQKNVWGCSSCFKRGSLGLWPESKTGYIERFPDAAGRDCKGSFGRL